MGQKVLRLVSIALSILFFLVGLGNLAVPEASVEKVLTCLAISVLFLPVLDPFMQKHLKFKFSLISKILMFISLFWSLGYMAHRQHPRTSAASAPQIAPAEVAELPALTNTGMMYLTGKGILPQDYPKAVKFLRLSAEKGDKTAQGLLSVIYYTGEGGIDRDYKLAESFARKAAVQGDTTGSLTLGNIYFKGTPDVRVDYSEAAKWYFAAAKNGNAQAQSNLGMLYIVAEATKAPAANFHAFEGSSNLEEALFWLQVATLDGAQQSAAQRDYLAKIIPAARVTEIEAKAAAFAVTMAPGK